MNDTTPAVWAASSVFHGSWSRKNSLLGSGDQFSTCATIQAQSLGYFKSQRVVDQDGRTRFAQSPLGAQTSGKDTRPTIRATWEISPKLLSHRHVRVCTLKFNFDLANAERFDLLQSGLPLEFAQAAASQTHNPWWTVRTSHGPIAFDTATAMELAFGTTHRIANLLLNPFTETTFQYWHARTHEHLWVRAPSALSPNITIGEAICTSFWLGHADRTKALEHTKRALLTGDVLRLPKELNGLHCDAVGILVDNMLYVQCFAFQGSRPALPVLWRKLILIERANALRGSFLERPPAVRVTQTGHHAIRKQPMSPLEVEEALRTASSPSVETPTNEEASSTSQAWERLAAACRVEASQLKIVDSFQKYRNAASLLMTELESLRSFLLTAIESCVPTRESSVQLGDLWQGWERSGVVLNEMRQLLAGDGLPVAVSDSTTKLKPGGTNDVAH